MSGEQFSILLSLVVGGVLYAMILISAYSLRRLSERIEQLEQQVQRLEKR